jgi:hypothetical protein
MEVPLQNRLVVLSRELSGVSSGDGSVPVIGFTGKYGDAAHKFSHRSAEDFKEDDLVDDFVLIHPACRAWTRATVVIA